MKQIFSPEASCFWNDLYHSCGNKSKFCWYVTKRETLTDVKLKQNVKVNRVGNGVVDRCVGYPKTFVVIHTKASRQVWENVRNN
jgi:hypothetical protein